MAIRYKIRSQRRKYRLWSRVYTSKAADIVSLSLHTNPVIDLRTLPRSLIVYRNRSGTVRDRAHRHAVVLRADGRPARR